jgi:hypothetical protein
LTKLEKKKKTHLGLNFSQIWLNSLVDDRHSKIPDKLFTQKKKKNQKKNPAAI